LAVVLTGEARWAEAEAAYRQALELNPDHAESYYGLCKVAELQDDLQAALQYCQQAYKLSPNSFATCYTLGTLLLKLNRWDEATVAYQQGLELNPDFAWSYHNLGYTLLKQGNLEEATVKLRRAAELLPESPWTFYHFADALGQIEAWDESIAALLRAIAIQPDLPGAYYKLGALVRRRMALGLENTVAYYQQSLPPQGKPPASEFYQAIAAQLIDVNQIDGAYLFARLALHLQPNQAQLYTQVEQLWAKREQLNQRLTELQQGIAENPESSWLYTELGNLLANQGETEQAIELHRQAAAQRGWQRSISKGYGFTHDWFTHTIPVWTEHLKRFVNAEVNALEIGSFEGMSTCWLLDYILTNPNARITCIDHYFQEVFDTNIVKTGSPEKVIKLTGDSHQLLAALEPETYDLIYIDGNHLAEHARQDAALSWPLLKPGGLLVFDDYEWSDANFPGQETKLGIDMFLHSVQPHVEILYQGYQMIVKKSVACPSILSDSHHVKPDSTMVSQTSAAN
jgi:tetratricopeptide (TPR) repeat protein